MTNNTVTVERVFDAPVELVWKAWTTPEHFVQWWGPKGFTSPVCTIDFRVGGKYVNCMASPDGFKIWSTGTYQEIIPLERIVYTYYHADENGNAVAPSYYGMDDSIPMETQVTLLFEAQDGKTKLTLQHVGLPAGEMGEQAAMGWNESFDKLSESLLKEKAE